MKNAASVILTANLIKHHLGLELSIEERRYEPALVGEDAQVDGAAATA
ncbi:hypothetical protein [Polyangium sp. 15x6]|nr:hypothetical protein [Polyangium sp. 15x6]MDI3290703.1 hypothetical protein [Polyangium sp. 15x6]